MNENGPVANTENQALASIKWKLRMIYAGSRLRGMAYRAISRFLHRFNLHYAPPQRIDDSTAWCQWCGLRGQVFTGKYSPDFLKFPEEQNCYIELNESL